jgi:hypothetical protein
VSSSLLNAMATDFTLQKITTQYLNTVTQSPTVRSFALAGSVAGATADPEISALCTKSTNWRGQAGRGRFSLPVPVSGLQTTTNNTDILATAQLNLNQLLCNAVNHVFLPGVRTWYPCLVGNRAQAFPPPRLLLPKGSFYGTQLTACTAQSQLGTTRRRKRGRGR